MTTKTRWDALFREAGVDQTWFLPGQMPDIAEIVDAQLSQEAPGQDLGELLAENYDALRHALADVLGRGPDFMQLWVEDRLWDDGSRGPSVCVGFGPARTPIVDYGPE